MYNFVCVDIFIIWRLCESPLYFFNGLYLIYLYWTYAVPLKCYNLVSHFHTLFCLADMLIPINFRCRFVIFKIKVTVEAQCERKGYTDISVLTKVFFFLQSWNEYPLKNNILISAQFWNNFVNNTAIFIYATYINGMQQFQPKTNYHY